MLAAVAEHKSFAFVADRLSLSPAMTSKHVQHIEARVPDRSYLPAKVRSFLDFLAGPNGLGKL